MTATTLWNPLQLWRHKRRATLIGFAPSVVGLILQSAAISSGTGALIAVLGWFTLGWALSFIVAACRRTIPRWVTGAFVLLGGLLVIAVLSSPPRSTPAIIDPTTVTPTAGNVDPFRQIAEQMFEGVVGFDYPLKMRVGDYTDVSLRVAVPREPKEPQNEVKTLSESLTREGRDPIVIEVNISSRMKAELKGPGFEITRLGSEEQILDAKDYTTWTWSVRALEAGKQQLIVTLTAILEIENSEGVRDVRTLYREVEVEAIPITWWRRTWDIAEKYGPSRDVVWPAIPAIVVAVWGFLFARKKVRSKRKR